MKSTPRTIGFLQAAGLTIYVSLFAATVQWAQQWARMHGAQPQPMFGIILFLLTFIISAIVCASLLLAYPISLFFSNKKSEAVRTVAWSLTFLIIFFIAFLTLAFMQTH